ncbi:MAG: HAD-IC family P-type ATPase [Clostridia bacterium]|nr:HAD-IC family P-type ATPase [Clostridia bacterium]
MRTKSKKTEAEKKLEAEAAVTAEAAAEAELIPETEPEEKAAKNKRSFSSRVLEGAGAQKEKQSRKSVMKRFKKAKKIPSESEVERFTPDLDQGLTEAQVDTRFNQFLFNDVNKKYSKSYASIFIGNICTFFNLLCLLVAGALLYAHAGVTQFLFVAIFGANLFIGILQEILAKKQVDKLSVLISATTKVMRGGVKMEIPVREIVVDDVVILEAGQQVPADCSLADGNVEVNESLLTGESIPIKKAEGELLYAGSFISSGSCRVRVEKVGRATYINSLTSKAKKYKKPKSEIMNSIRLFIRVIACLIPVVAGLMFWRNWTVTGHDMSESIQLTGAVVIGMIPSGLLLLTSFAMALGVLRLAKKHTLVQDLYSLEMLARVNVLCLDKTGTITDGRMTVNDCMILGSFTQFTLDEIMGSMLSALDDNNQTSIALYNRFGHSTALQPTATIPFSSKRKLSAVTFGSAGTYVMGAPEYVVRPMPPKIEKIVKQYAQAGLRVLLLAHSQNAIVGDKLPSLFRPVAIITLADNVRNDAIDTIKWFRENDVEIKIISGDNPVTVSEVARRVGVKHAGQYISLDGLTDIEVENVASQYTVFGRVTPEQKAILVKAIKKQGNTVAMTGDGVNDILALKEADCAISVASGSEAARNVSHLVLTDNNFLTLPSVVFEGRRVINNIKSSASLYIMKTLFITILAIFCFAVNSSYFFKTNNMLLFEMFIAAVPSAVITLQPNKSRVKGKFIPYVLSRSIPGALTMFIGIVAVYLGTMYLSDNLGTLFVEAGDEKVINPLMMLALTLIGLVMLFRIMQPFNIIRALAYVFSAAVSMVVLCVPVLGNLVFDHWSELSFNFSQILYTICMVLAAFPISDLLIRLCDLMNPSEKEKGK